MKIGHPAHKQLRAGEPPPRGRVTRVAEEGAERGNFHLSAAAAAGVATRPRTESQEKKIGARHRTLVLN